MPDRDRDDRREQFRRAEDAASLRALIVAPKIGLIDRFEHLHECVEEVKKTVWKANGALALLVVVLQVVLHIYLK